MPEILITEFMDPDAVELLRSTCDVAYDADLWSNEDKLRQSVDDIAALIVRNRTQVTADLLDKAPNLKVVGRLGVGLDNIDLKACDERGVVVHPATGANANSVAEYVIASALILVRAGAYHAAPRLVSGAWPREELACGGEVAGRTLGIIGLGSVGSTVARKAAALDLNIIAHDPHLPDDHDNWSLAQRVSLDAVLTSSDIVTLHGPLSSETSGMIGEAQIATMKPGACLINSARGGMVDHDALVAALRSGQLCGAAIDVFEDEPISAEAGRLFEGIENVILTPHISGVTHEANHRVSFLTAHNVAAELGVELNVK